MSYARWQCSCGYDAEARSLRESRVCPRCGGRLTLDADSDLTGEREDDCGEGYDKEDN